MGVQPSFWIQDSGMDDLKLTEREMLIAEKAAELAVKKMQDEFYKTVGKSVIEKVFIVIGALTVVGSIWFNSWFNRGGN
jgi:hypothetical protein